MIRINCPQCGIGLSVRQTSIGSMIRCKSCGTKITIGMPETKTQSDENNILNFFVGCCGLIGLVAICGFCGLGYQSFSKFREESKAEVVQADQFYELGKRAEAVAVYKKKFQF